MKMASVVVTMVGGALVNALAFSGSNYLFSRISKSDPSEITRERERHDRAIEELESAKEKFNEDRMRRMDFLSGASMREHESTEHSRESIIALKEYYDLKEPVLSEPVLSEPVLSDFYQPSEDQKDREILFVALGMSAVLFLSWKLW